MDGVAIVACPASTSPSHGCGRPAWVRFEDDRLVEWEAPACGHGLSAEGEQDELGRRGRKALAGPAWRVQLEGPWGTRLEQIVRAETLEQARGGVWLLLSAQIRPETLWTVVSVSEVTP